MNARQNRTDLKVSLVVGDLSTSGAGRWGGAVRPFLLANALQKLNYQVEIVGFDFDNSNPTQTAGIPITAIPGEHYPKFFKSAQELLQHIDGDIIYSIKLKLTSFGLSLIKMLQTKRPVILDIDDWELSWHGGDNWQYNPSFKQLARDIFKDNGALRYPDHPLYLQWAEKLVPHANATTVHTQFLQKRFGGVYVPNGKDVELFNPTHYNPDTSRAIYGLTNYRVLMFPGAPRPYKGLEDVLTALDLLNEDDLRLVIVGGSPYDDYDEQLIERWGRWIIKLPKVPYEKMPEVVSAAHVIVIPQRDHPTTWAQFPLKLTDGMAMEKPILSTFVGDIPEILGDTGYLVNPNSPEQIAEKIQWIFQNFEEATIRGQEARQRCEKHYSIETMSRLLSEMIHNLS